LSLPVLSAKTTSFVPKAWMACGAPSRNDSARPMQCQPRAKRVGGAPASIDRIAGVLPPELVSVMTGPPQLPLGTEIWNRL
jgi:hypothetical protein